MGYSQYLLNYAGSPLSEKGWRLMYEGMSMISHR